MLQRIAQDALDRELARFHAGETIAGLDATAALRDAAAELAVAQTDAGRRLKLLELPDPIALRDLAANVRQHTVDHLDLYLDRFARAATANGTTVRFAASAAAARVIVQDLSRDQTITIALPAGADETGLLGGPSSPAATFALDWSRRSDAPTKRETVGTVAVVGATFLVAESGAICVADNTGLAARAVTTPHTLVVIAGIEKVLPRSADLTLMLKLLARSAAGQALTNYTSLLAGPRRADASSGPATVHVVLIDNGRSNLLADMQARETLRCIACGACRHASPVSRKAGDDVTRAGGFAHSGPIGAVMSAQFDGVASAVEAIYASPLDGAADDACPVKINLSRHNVRLRRAAVREKLDGPLARVAFLTWSWLLHRPKAYRRVIAWRKKKLRRRADASGFVRNVPWPVSAWGRAKDLPAPPARAFRDWWRERT